MLKKLYMTTKLLFVILYAALASCTKSASKGIQPVEDDLSMRTPHGTWRLVSSENFSTEEAFYKDPSDVNPYCKAGRPCDIILTFSGTDSTGSIVGHTITNEMSGAFSFDATSRRFTTLGFGGTKLGEPRWSDAVWDNMYNIESFSVNNQHLRLYFDAKKQSLTFARD
jgi:hypothetical protein